MTDEHSTTPAPNDEGVTVQLRPVDCDAILAALEAALNAGLNFGPGLHTRNVEEAGRRIEAVADLARRGISTSTGVREDEAARDVERLRGLARESNRNSPLSHYHRWMLTRALDRLQAYEKALREIAEMESVVQREDGPMIFVRDEQMRELARAALKGEDDD